MKLEKRKILEILLTKDNPMLHYKIKEINQNESVIEMWNNIIPMVRNTLDYIPNEISIAVAERYRFDLYGLFVNELKIPDEFIYPNFLINGYVSSDEFQGDKTKFLTANLVQLSKYLDVYQQQL